uniref:ABC transporter permease n=1 Tax=Desulfosarcina cetonica TaxID=90730 RepID=UPI0006D25DCE
LPDTVPAPRIEIHFDPTVMGGYRSAVHHLMELTVLRIEVAEIFKALSGQLSGASQRPLTSPTPPLAGPWPSSPAFNFQADSPAMPLLRVEDGDAAAGQRPRLPTAVQQNVPAWSLFGIFFIVLPISGAFIQERVDGTRQRLAAMPVGYATLVGGRIIAYAGICGIQCILIGCIGKWLLPLWGSPALEMGHAPLALFTLLAGAILAATGFGILLGSVVDSYQQAAVIGPISVVIAAALGGIMVPVYAMPTFMQKISVISPLGWGLTGVIDVFVRGGRIGDVLPETAALVAFFIGCIIVAGMWQRRARTGGRLR